MRRVLALALLFVAAACFAGTAHASPIGLGDLVSNGVSQGVERVVVAGIEKVVAAGINNAPNPQMIVEPEPSSLLLVTLGAGIACLNGRRRRR